MPHKLFGVPHVHSQTVRSGQPVVSKQSRILLYTKLPTAKKIMKETKKDIIFYFSNEIPTYAKYSI